MAVGTQILKHKVALVTGSSRGIGAACVLALAREGADVIINYVQRESEANILMEKCHELGVRALKVKADVTQQDDLKNMLAVVNEHFGRLDILVNNAFTPYKFDPENRTAFAQSVWIDIQTQLDGCVKSTFQLTQLALTLMSNPDCAIVNIVTNLVQRPIIPYHDYVVAKAGLLGLSRLMAQELGGKGIRVNCVAPGLVQNTSSSMFTKESVRREICHMTPMKRIATVEDIANAVLLFTVPWSKFITGQILYVDGGLVML
ncbi:MAG: SDR family oxidoreductase [Gammaproteobacteria bacterium]|nr:SDR family oxidoreductase [Gammaproteobacteria bacterium]